jgi:hypothetical protein
VIRSYDKSQLLNILCYFNGVQTVKRDKLIEAVATPDSSLHDDEEKELGKNLATGNFFNTFQNKLKMKNFAK